MTDSSSSHAMRPMTPAESLRHRYRQRSNISDGASESSEDGSTTASTATASTRFSGDRLSTSSAKLRELDAVIQRQKKASEKKDAKNSERISLIERQLHRISDLDSKLDSVQTDFGQRMNLFESRMVDTVKGHIESSNHNMVNMNTSLEKLMEVVNKLVSQGEITTATSTNTVAVSSEHASTMAPEDRLHSNEEGGSSGSTSNSSSSRSSMSAVSTGLVQSPEHKRRKQGKKKPLKESIRRYLDSTLKAASQSPSTDCLVKTDSFDSLDIAMQHVEEIVNSNTSSKTPPAHCAEIPDPESQYTAGPTTHEDESDKTAPPSLGRGSPS